MAKTIRSLQTIDDQNKTASRKRGWLVFGLCVLVFGASQIVVAASPKAAFWAILILEALAILFATAMVQRLQDAGRAGYWTLPVVVSVVGVVAALIVFFLLPLELRTAGQPIARKIGLGLLIAYAGLVLSRALLWLPIWVPTESMKPGLLVGDYVVTTFVSARDLNRGDVVVFRHPVSLQSYIMRLIGLPGETVQMKNGLLHINDVAVLQVPNGTFDEIMAPQGPLGNLPRCGTPLVAIGDVCSRIRNQETLPNGRSLDVLKIDDGGVANNTAKFFVPDGHFFFMGENRDNSFDSRYPQSVGGLGFVPFENIQSRAHRVLYSAAGQSMANIRARRNDRFWMKVQ